MSKKRQKIIIPLAVLALITAGTAMGTIGDKKDKLDSAPAVTSSQKTEIVQSSTVPLEDQKETTVENTSKTESQPQQVAVSQPETAKKAVVIPTKSTVKTQSPVKQTTSAPAAQSKPADNVTPSRGGNRTLTMLATAYEPGPVSNGKWAGISHLGTPLGYGIVAVDPNVIPLGSRLYIEGYGEGYAADTGGAIKGNRIDLCFDTYEEAIQFGMKTVKVTILELPK